MDPNPPTNISIYRKVAVQSTGTSQSLSNYYQYPNPICWSHVTVLPTPLCCMYSTQWVPDVLYNFNPWPPWQNNFSPTMAKNILEQYSDFDHNINIETFFHISKTSNMQAVTHSLQQGSNKMFTIIELCCWQAVLKTHIQIDKHFKITILIVIQIQKNENSNMK